jgi:putative oxidoreductase
MSKLKSFVNQPDFGLLLFRFFVGATMAFSHGLGKVPPSEQLIQGVTGIGFPLPVVFAWAAALSEFVGGLLIAAGLFTRLSAVFLGFTMGVAAFVVHGADPFNVKEMALLYFASAVLLFFTGAGQYSADRLLRKK